MSVLFAPIRRRLSLKVSLFLTILMVVMVFAVAAYIIASGTKLQEETLMAKARMASELGAQTYSTTLSEAIDNGAISVSDAFDRNYIPIEGFDWGANPKYHTRYDSFTDKAVLVFQDKFLEDKDFVFALGVDGNGYVPTHNSKYQKRMTNDPAKDGPGNRSKRIFNDKVGLIAAQNTTPGLVQSYVRDTGERMWDVSSPIYVKGKHWGGFRIGVSMERVEAAKADLRRSLIMLFGGFIAVVVVAIFMLVRRSMKSVAELTKVANDISVGEGLGREIKPKSIDEIGVLAASIERLRASMKLAMDRLGE